MALANRKGWIRVGLVLSTAWLIGVLIHAAFDYHSVRADLVTAVRTADPSLVNSRWEVIGQETFLTTCDVKDKEVSCSPRALNLAALGLIPIAISWLAAVLLVIAVMWVRAGFRDHET
jgi:hypothetical protein